MKKHWKKIEKLLLCKTVIIKPLSLILIYSFIYIHCPQVASETEKQQKKFFLYENKCHSAAAGKWEKNYLTNNGRQQLLSLASAILSLSIIFF